MEKFLISKLDKHKNFLKNIKDYKIHHEFNGKIFMVNVIDYIYMKINSVNYIQKQYKDYNSFTHFLYTDILKNKPGNYNMYSKNIDIVFYDDNIRINIGDISYYTYEEKKITIKIYSFITKILENILNNHIKLYTIECNTCYEKNQQDKHSEIIFFQIIDNTLYLVNYDPLGETAYTNKFLDLLVVICENFFKTKRLNIEVKKIYSENLTFNYKGEKLGGLQTLTDNIFYLEKNHKPYDGICLVYSYFMIYLLINVIYFYKNYPCYQAIIDIESVIYDIFIKDKTMFGNIIINFSNYILDMHYTNLLFEIEKKYGLLEKERFKTRLYEIDMYYLEYLIKNNMEIKEKDKEIIYNNIYTKSSGYACKRDIECSSYKCLNNICYIDEKNVDPEDVRNVGNPCLYNIQCRSKKCKDNICIGDDNLQRDKNPVYYEDEILDKESRNIYLNRNM
jgi:hypothetical protein